MKRSFTIGVVLCILTILPVLSIAQLDPNSPWPMFQNDAQHTGRSDMLGPQGGTIAIKWSYFIDGGIGNPVLAGDGQVYTGSYNNNLYSLLSDGSFSWSYDIDDSLWAPPAVDAQGRVLAGSGNRFYALVSDCSLSWSYLTNGDLSPVTIGSDGSIFIGSYDNRVYALSSSASLHWSYQTGGSVRSPSLDTGGNVYMGGVDDRLYKLDSQGSLLWSYSATIRINSYPTIGQSNRVYMGSGEGILYGIDSSGSLLWSYKLGSSISPSPALGTDGSLYVGGFAPFSRIASDGSLVWSYNGLGEVYSSATLDANGAVYVGANRFMSFASNGSLAWSYERIGSSSPTIGINGILYCGGENSLLAVQALVPGPTPSPTPTSPTPSPTPTPVPSLSIEPSELKAGSSFSFIIALTQPITEQFDYYIIADTQFGPYTLYFDGRVGKGITPLYTNVPGYPAPYEKTVIPNVILPLTMGGKEVTFYTVVVEAGKMPPVSSLSELTADTPYVIMLDKKTVTVEP